MTINKITIEGCIRKVEASSSDKAMDAFEKLVEKSQMIQHLNGVMTPPFSDFIISLIDENDTHYMIMMEYEKEMGLGGSDED